MAPSKQRTKQSEIHTEKRTAALNIGNRLAKVLIFQFISYPNTDPLRNAVERRGFMNRTTEHSTGQIIRFFREREGLTQEELADIIHVTKGKLAHWEDDVTIPQPTMVARLQGALRISDADMPLLLNAVKAAEDKRAQEQVALQAFADEQSAEDKRLFHRSKAIHLVLMGLGGFAAGFVLTFLIGSTKDFPWYAPFVIGLCLAGVPFGWDLIRDKSGLRIRTIYYGPDSMLIQFMADLIGFALKFIAAYVIGLIIFPVALFYHAYHAGRPGSLFKTVMRVLLILIVLVLAAILVMICCASMA